MARADAERERVAARRFWAAMRLAHDVDVCRSILRGLPVVARQLDVAVLRDALRGGPLPPADEFLVVSAAMLDAAAEAEGRRS